MREEYELTDAELEAVAAGMGKIRGSKTVPLVAKRVAAPGVMLATNTKAAPSGGGCSGGVCPA